MAVYGLQGHTKPLQACSCTEMSWHGAEHWHIDFPGEHHSLVDEILVPFAHYMKSYNPVIGTDDLKVGSLMLNWMVVSRETFSPFCLTVWD